MATRKKAAPKKAKKAAVDNDNTGLVQVRLDDGQWRGRCDELASEIKRLENTEAKKKAAVHKFNAELKLHHERIAVLAEEVDTRSALVDPQVAMDYPTGNRSIDRERGFGDEDEAVVASNDDGDEDEDAPPPNVTTFAERRRGRGGNNGAASGLGT